MCMWMELCIRLRTIENKVTVQLNVSSTQKSSSCSAVFLKCLVGFVIYMQHNSGPMIKSFSSIVKQTIRQ